MDHSDLIMIHPCDHDPLLPQELFSVAYPFWRIMIATDHIYSDPLSGKGSQKIIEHKNRISGRYCPVINVSRKDHAIYLIFPGK